MHTHDIPSIHHIACQAVLAMAARAVASKEFEADPEVSAVQIIVRRAAGSESSVDVDFLSAAGFAMGGVSL